MPTDIKLKNSVTATNAPTSLQQGEVAINITDKKVWVGNAATTPVLLLGSGADGTFTNLTVSGVASFADGTVSLPSITNIGDTNTGIYFPAADTIAFTEGGVESMRIDASGNLGIGTTTPSSFPFGKLVIGTTSGNGSATIASATTGEGTIAFADGTSGTDGYRGFIQYNHASDNLIFGTSGVEAMRINSTGRVGIGVTTPAFPLDIFAANAVMRLNSTTGTNSAYLYTSNSGGDFYFAKDNSTGTSFGGSAYAAILYSSGAYPMQIYTNGSERMRIASNGNVGIGTNNPTTKLQVDGPFLVQNAGNGATVLQLNDNVGTVVNQFIDIDLAKGGGAYTYYKLNMNGSPIMTWGAALSSYASNLSLSSPAGSVIFNANGGERMRITFGGNLLVGQSSLDANAGGALFQLTQNNANWIHYITNTASSGTVWGQYIHYQNSAPNNTTSNFFFCADNAALRATFRSNGGLANYSGNDVNLSDAREKTNIELAGSYLDKICSIPVKTFNYIDQNREEDDGLTLGVLAQDVQAVAPELVMESNWAAKDEPEKMRLSIYQTDLQYALMKSIQELKAELDSVKAELQTLKGK
jgi:hypothetical protein